MAEIGNKVYLDSWNYFIMYANEVEVDSANNRSKVSYGLNLHVAQRVESSSIKAAVTDRSVDIGYRYYGPGTHTIVSNEKWFDHNDDGTGTAYLSWWWTSFIGNWSGSAALPLTTIKRATPISTFTGDSITGNFRATFTAESGYTYKLRISIPHIYMLQKYDNYVSGTNVTLSDESIAYIRNYTNNPTVQIGGVIETYKNGSFIGESEELMIYPRTTSGVRLRINGAWKEAVPYVRVNGTWKEAIPYVRVNNQWKEGI